MEMVGIGRGPSARPSSALADSVRLTRRKEGCALLLHHPPILLAPAAPAAALFTAGCLRLAVGTALGLAPWCGAPRRTLVVARGVAVARRLRGDRVGRTEVGVEEGEARAAAVCIDQLVRLRHRYRWQTVSVQW